MNKGFKAVHVKPVTQSSQSTVNENAAIQEIKTA